MPKVRVHIVVLADGEFGVQPPVVSADKNDSITVINTTAEDAVFRFETTTVFQGGDQTVSLKANGGKKNLPIAGTAPDGVYPYQVVMLKSGKKAKGNSDPSIIIDN